MGEGKGVGCTPTWNRSGRREERARSWPEPLYK